MYTAAKQEDAKEDAIHKSRRTAEEVKSGVHRVKRDIHDTADAVMDDLDGIKENLNELAARAGRQVREYAEYAEENFVERIREKPVSSVAIAVGVGALIGAIFFRRS